MNGIVPGSKKGTKERRGKETGKIQIYFIGRLESRDFIPLMLKHGGCEHWAWSWTTWVSILPVLLPSCVILDKPLCASMKWKE